MAKATSVYIMMLKLFNKVSLSTGRGGSSGAKFRISLGLPVGAVINCADNTGTSQIAFYTNQIVVVLLRLIKTQIKDENALTDVKSAVQGHCAGYCRLFGSVS